MNYLLDTDICIYILNNKNPALEAKFKSHLTNKIAVSTLTEAELYYGALHSSRPIKNKERVKEFLEPLLKVPFDSEAALKFAEIKQALLSKGKPIGAIDMLIASIARTQEFALITNNVKHFKEISGLAVESWV